MEYDLNPTPNWFYEASIILTFKDSNRIHKMIENHESFGISKNEMKKKLSKYVEYEKTVLSKILPIYEDYLYLNKYFKEIEIGSSDYHTIAPALASVIGRGEHIKLSRDDIDAIVKDFIIDEISDFSKGLKKDKEINFNSLEELMKYLNRSKVMDEMKLILMELYYNRYEVLEGIVELLKQCAPICEKYFYIIKEDFNAALKLINDTHDINRILDMDASVKIHLKESIHSFICISNFNAISLIGGKNDYTLYVGIYFFHYLELKNQNEFNDPQLISDFKALGDATRLKIIHMLSSKNMYVQEISNELGLTPATVSHHMNVLLKSKLITITLDTENPKTIYYELNNEKFYILGNAIKNLADFKED